MDSENIFIPLSGIKLKRGFSISGLLVEEDSWNGNKTYYLVFVNEFLKDKKFCLGMHQQYKVFGDKRIPTEKYHLYVREYKISENPLSFYGMNRYSSNTGKALSIDTLNYVFSRVIANSPRTNREIILENSKKILATKI